MEKFTVITDIILAGFDDEIQASNTTTKVLYHENLQNIINAAEFCAKDARTTIVLMINHEKNKCFVYKYDKSLKHLKKVFFPNMEDTYMQITGFPLVFKEIEDLRILNTHRRHYDA